MKKFFITIVTISILLLGYDLYPRSGSFNDLLVSKYSEKPFKEIEISQSNKVVKDADEINEFLSYLNKFKLVEYSGKIPYKKNDGIYDIGIYDNSNNLLGITIKNKEYIEVFISSEKVRDNKKYKVVHDSLDMEYIKNFCD